MKGGRRFADNNFTVLRLALALLVVLGHFHLLAGDASPPWPYSYASFAVDCFFVVSGYLVTNSLDRDPNLLRFYTRRFFRLYPLYIAVVAAQAVAIAMLDPLGLRENLYSLMRYFVVNAVFANFLQHNLGHGVMDGLANPGLNPSLWTLKIEFGFYLLLPLIWWAVRRFGAAVLVGIFALSAAYYGVVDGAGYYIYAKQLPGQLQFFVLGIAAYMFRDRLVLRPAAGLALAAVLGLWCTALLRTHPLVIYPLVVGAFVVVVALGTPRIWLRRDFSYGVYLLHGPLIQLALLLGWYQPTTAWLLAVVAAVILLALLVERLIEAPGIALCKRLCQQIGRGMAREPPSAIEPATNGTATKPRAVRPRAAAPAELVAVILNDFCYVQGGASKVAIDEALALSRRGVKVIFLGAVGPPCDDLARPPLTVECLAQRELLDVGRHPMVALQGLWNMAAARRMRAVLRSLPRDRTVVHLHGYTKALTTSPVRAARRLGFPVVCTLHDFFPACPNGAFFDYGKGEPCAKRPFSAACIAANCDKRRYAHKLFRLVRGLAQRWLGRFPGAVEHYISLSERSATILAPYLPRRARIHSLPNITDAVPEPPIPVADNRNILCIGRLDPEKGVRLLAEATRQLGAAVTFVGDGPLRGEIEGIPGISVTGWLSRDEVHRQLSTARCVVFPSLWYETYGLAVAEAASRGIPVIVSDISAAAERIEEGVTGWCFRSGDMIDLARCLRLVANDRVVRAAGDAAYRAFWARPETWKVHADSLVSIYRAALRS